MESKNLLTLAITLTVGIILAGSLLMPVISDATATERTYVNEGYFNLEKYTDADSITLTWDYADPDVFTINDETITYHNNTGMAVSVVLGTYFAIRLADNNANLSYFGWGQYVAANSTTPNMTFTYENGGISVTNGTTTKTNTGVGEIYTIAESGDYVMKKSTSIAYLNSGSEIVADSEIYASGQTFNGSNYIFWHMEGTIEDMQFPDVFTTSLTITNEQINGEYSTVCDDLYELQNITFVATNSNNVEFNVTASYFVVPASVTAKLTNHLNPGEIAIMNAIPLLIIVALVVMAAGALYLKRDD